MTWTGIRQAFITRTIYTNLFLFLSTSSYKRGSIPAEKEIEIITTSIWRLLYPIKYAMYIPVYDPASNDFA